MVETQMYTVTLVVDYGPIILSMDEIKASLFPPELKQDTKGLEHILVEFKKLEFTEMLLARVKADAMSVRDPDNPVAVGIGISKSGHTFYVTYDFQLKPSEAYADADLEAHNYKEHSDLCYFMPMLEVLLAKCERPYYLKPGFAPQLYIHSPEPCAAFVERALNHYGKTINTQKAALLSDAEMHLSEYWSLADTTHDTRLAPRVLDLKR